MSTPIQLLLAALLGGLLLTSCDWQGPAGKAGESADEAVRDFKQTGEASWYGPGFQKKQQAGRSLTRTSLPPPIRNCL